MAEKRSLKKDDSAFGSCFLACPSLNKSSDDFEWALDTSDKFASALFGTLREGMSEQLTPALARTHGKRATRREEERTRERDGWQTSILMQSSHTHTWPHGRIAYLDLNAILTHAYVATW